eukprot:TRINITY_DN294_c1_g1_i1.p1 TRINITY_DN294_c1_g1~~TRINITY_DN294_c1_g1_i1.p1  ORF type:complete len:478 (+),score=161.54 TRINITY_DN294_c1_g1_i1:123-1556(+)
MPPKKKGKGKKGKGKKEEVVELPIYPEFDVLTQEAAHQELAIVEAQCKKASADRNYAQNERDHIQTFYDITQKEIEVNELKAEDIDREIEKKEEDHRAEVRVYAQKVKHLEYEQQKNISLIEEEGKNAIGREHSAHDEKRTQLKKHTDDMKSEKRETDQFREKEVQILKSQNEKNIAKLREQFAQNLNTRAGTFQEAEKELEEDLKLRQKVEIHEIEERKNQHIQQLMANHQKAFTNIKKYYQAITRDNLKLIQSLKKQVSDMKAKGEHSKKLMVEITHENKRLSEPLQSAQDEVKRLEHELRDFNKDKDSLKNAKARVVLMKAKGKSLQQRNEGLKDQLQKKERDRDELHASFETAVHKVKQRADFKNLVLERKLERKEFDHGKKDAQLQEIVNVANLDPTVLQRVSDNIDHLVDSRDQQIKDLEFQLIKRIKANNDKSAVYKAKLTDFGIPEDELTMKEIPNAYASKAPADLVAH